MKGYFFIFALILAFAAVTFAEPTHDVHDFESHGNLLRRSTCDPSGCNSTCRRMKLPGGVCVNGKCKCDNF
ncbi:hypothetical protein K1T71_004881 [Dendrolimus kikuchii]|uniref:Uncharacterized protein n=1 Tax=Dendrolimus kikuchii TaxID=765133 RepID=A0ACC1D624_9NEOP|nr:hypothetical protein K1T71_004881 [Dendrolimus kikuchii]